MTKVLLLEDETMIQMLIEDYILDLGYEVMVASNLSEGLHICDSEKIDLAILDINLGDGTNSFPLAELLMQRNIPFAFMTGYHAHGIDGFQDVSKLSKPINFNMLKMALDDLSKGDISPETED